MRTLWERNQYNLGDNLVRGSKLKFKTQHQAEQFVLIKPKLRGILLDLAFFVARKYDLILTITELYRTQEEQNHIYANNPKYQKEPWKSVHQYWRGADVRVDFSPNTLVAILKYLNSNYIYDPKRPQKPTAIVHNVGRGNHIHIQVWEVGS